MEQDQQRKQLQTPRQHIKDQHILGHGRKNAKFLLGPTSSSPGPILFIVAATAVKLVVMSHPSIDTSRTEKENKITNVTK